MHSRITLILWHHEDHHPPLPVIELHTDDDEREVQVCFHEADDESSELVGCPECVVHLLRATAMAIETQLANGRWVAGDVHLPPDFT